MPALVLKEWQGINSEGALVQTSKAWARLEKAISLQMIKNIETQSQRFTRWLGSERMQQLMSCHRFFGIKRTRPLSEPSQVRTFKTLEAFAKADSETLAKKYEKAFKV